MHFGKCETTTSGFLVLSQLVVLSMNFYGYYVLKKHKENTFTLNDPFLLLLCFQVSHT